jgi:hypothetical protein
MAMTCSIHEKKRNAYRVLAGKAQGKRSPGRPIYIGRRIISKWILEK